MATTIADSLVELEHDIKQAYIAVQDKNGELPTYKNTNNLADAIISIPTDKPPVLPNASIIGYGFASTGQIYGISGVVVRGTGAKQTGWSDTSSAGTISPSGSSVGAFYHLSDGDMLVFDPENGEILAQWDSFPKAKDLAEGEFLPISQVFCWPCTETGTVTGDPVKLYLGAVDSRFTARGLTGAYQDCFVKPNGELFVFEAGKHYLLTLKRLGFFRMFSGGMSNPQSACFSRDTYVTFADCGMEFVANVGPYQTTELGEKDYDVNRIRYMSMLGDWCSVGFPSYTNYTDVWYLAGDMTADGYRGWSKPASAAGQSLKIGYPVVLPESVIAKIKTVKASTNQGCLLQFGSNYWHYNTSADDGVMICQWRGGPQMLMCDKMATGTYASMNMGGLIKLYK